MEGKLKECNSTLLMHRGDLLPWTWSLNSWRRERGTEDELWHCGLFFSAHTGYMMRFMLTFFVLTTGFLRCSSNVVRSLLAVLCIDCVH